MRDEIMTDNMTATPEKVDREALTPEETEFERR